MYHRDEEFFVGKGQRPLQGTREQRRTNLVRHGRGLRRLALYPGKFFLRSTPLYMDRTDVTSSSTLNSIPLTSGHSRDLRHYRAKIVTLGLRTVNAGARLPH